MAIIDVIKYPDKRLKLEAQEVTGMNADIKKVIEDLRETMLAAGHSTGIAATQIGSLYRIVVVDASLNKKCADNHGFMVMINPEIVKHEGFVTSREGCMSVPDFTGNVNRAENIAVHFLDDTMSPKVIEANGFESILIQHETDHLDGILFVDRVISKRTDLFKRKKY